MTPTIRYPSGPITPHGAYHVLHDRIPQMALRSYDDTIVFNTMGGLAIPDRYNAPERFELKELKGLIPPWRMIDQKGATQDGVTFVDALYDPTDVIINGDVVGRNPQTSQRVYDDLIASLDAKQQSTLSFFTQRLGYWWAPVRWGGSTDELMTISKKRQKVSLRLRADNAFWQSYPSVDEFVFAYETALDEFGTDDPDDLGTGWTTSITGSGTGGVHVANDQIESTLLNGKTMVARKAGWTSTTNNQVVEIQIGTMGQWFYPLDAYDDIWARMLNTGTPGANGIRLRIRSHKLTVSYFIAGVETVMREQALTIPAHSGEKFRLVAGTEGDERIFSVMRGGATLWKFKEDGTGSPLGASNRSAGCGMAADGATEPATIRRWNAGDNVTGTQSKFLERINAGDQPMWDRYTCFGPGTFRFWNGPGAGPNEYVEYGPLLANQVVQLRTDPRKRGVKDMTVYPATPEQQAQFHNALLDFVSFLVGNSVEIVTDVLGSLLSLLGGGSAVVPPQGNLYSLLKGRWSKPIPAKPAGEPAQPYHVKVQIVDGNADSKIIAAGTPLRRIPM